MVHRTRRRDTERQIKSQSWYRWLVVIMGVAFIAASVLGFRIAHGPASGQPPLHQWVGLLVIGGMAAHLLLHGEWIHRVLARPFVTPARLHRVIELLLLLLVLTVLFSGLGVGGLLGGELERTQPWQGLHHLTSKLLIVLGGWHIIRHRRWLLAPFRRVRDVA